MSIWPSHFRHYVARSEASWMVTFADLLALIVTFFVMLISMNSLHLDRWNAVVESLTGQFNPARASFTLTESGTGVQAEKVAEASISLDYLSAVFEEATVRYSGVRGLAVHRLQDRVVISVPSAFLFAGQGGQFSSEGGRLLSNLASVFAQLPNEVNVVGHANENIGTSSPWAVSAHWANGVIIALNSAGYSASMTGYGLGPMRYSDLSASLPDLVRANLAQRVDIEVLDRLRLGVQSGGMDRGSSNKDSDAT